VDSIDATILGSTLPALAAHRFVIATDASLPHLASHLGGTCVTLFGPNDPAWKRPLGRRHVIVRRHVECAPCLLAKCPMDLRCQLELLHDRVWQAICGKLGVEASV
jgi:ADP-heptose:LPS heptosyltransferase